MEILTTRRLRLRPLHRQDAPRVLELAGDWAIARMLGDFPFPVTTEAAERYVRRERGEALQAVELGGELVGSVSYFMTGPATAELGFWLGRPWWGQGYAAEAASAMIQHGFGAGRIRLFTSGHFRDNPASARVLGRLGFVATEAADVWCKPREAWVPSIRYELKRGPQAEEKRGLLGWLGRAVAS